MATVTKEKAERSCRMDMRISERQRINYERAAALKGQTLTQWSTQHLDECALRDIEEGSTTWLSPEGFDAFCRLLEEPLPEATRALLTSGERWA